MIIDEVSRPCRILFPQDHPTGSPTAVKNRWDLSCEFAARSASAFQNLVEATSNSFRVRALPVDLATLGAVEEGVLALMDPGRDAGSGFFPRKWFQRRVA